MSESDSPQFTPAPTEVQQSNPESDAAYTPRWFQEDPWLAERSEGTPLVRLSLGLVDQLTLSARGFNADGTGTGDYEPTDEAPEGTLPWHVVRSAARDESGPWTRIIVGDKEAGNGYLIAGQGHGVTIKIVEGGKVTDKVPPDGKIHRMADDAYYNLEQTSGFPVMRST